MKTRQLAVGAALALASSLAWANVQYTFFANGVTDSYAEQGYAVFSFANDGSSLAITLADTVNPTAAIQSEITGLQFTLSSAPSSVSLASVVPSQVIDCTNSATPCPSGAGSSPYGWGAAQNGGGLSLGAGFNGSTFGYQPYGIVNANYLSGSGAGALGTPSNNPLLVGPVTFNFALTGLGSAPEVNSVGFLFGSPPVDPPATIPEPQSLALFAVGLLAAGWASRRKYVRA